MDEIMTGLGVTAAALTSLSYVPQVKKAWPRNSTFVVRQGAAEVR